jgi:hypothetical protein
LRPVGTTSDILYTLKTKIASICQYYLAFAKRKSRLVVKKGINDKKKSVRHIVRVRAFTLLVIFGATAAKFLITDEGVSKIIDTDENATLFFMPLLHTALFPFAAPSVQRRATMNHEP